MVVDPSNSLKGTSPSGRYTIEVSQNSAGITLDVKKAGGTDVLIVGPLPLDGWGFSPDDDRFVYFFRDSSGSAHVFLHDLLHPTSGGAGTPFVPVWSRSAGSFTYTVGFSPHGKYLLFVYNLSTQNKHIGMAVAKAQGGLAYETEYDINALRCRGRFD